MVQKWAGILQIGPHDKPKLQIFPQYGIRVEVRLHISKIGQHTVTRLLSIVSFHYDGKPRKTAKMRIYWFLILWEAGLAQILIPGYWPEDDIWWDNTDYGDQEDQYCNRDPWWLRFLSWLQVKAPLHLNFISASTFNSYESLSSTIYVEFNFQNKMEEKVLFG